MKKVKYDPEMMDTEHLKNAFVGACETGDKVVVEMLLPWVKRTDVNCSDRMRVTALMAALAKDQYEVCGTLLDLPGIDFSLRDIQGKTVLDHLLQSKSLFYFEEIMEEMEAILGEEELFNALLGKLTKCFPKLKENITMFSRMLAWYDTSYRKSELFSQAMLLAGKHTILAYHTIYPEDIPDSDEVSLNSIATAVAAGQLSLLSLVLRSHENVDMEELLRLCRDKGVEEDTINRDLYQALSLMLYRKDTGPLKCFEYLWEFDWPTFKLGLKLLDVNYVDQTWLGTNKTILGAVLHKYNQYRHWPEGDKIVREVLLRRELDLSVMNSEGETALDFLIVVESYRLSPYKVFDWSKSNRYMVANVGIQNPESLLPVVKFEKKFKDCVKTMSMDTQLFEMFKCRQETYSDVDFNYVKQSLLSKAMKACRLDLVRFLLINCNVKVIQCDLEVWNWVCNLEIEDRHWCGVRDILSEVVEGIVGEDTNKKQEDKM